MIAFWSIVIALTAAVVFVLARTGLMAREEMRQEAAGDIEIYKAQLAEVDRDLERETITPEEAEILRTEIARRLLAADEATREKAVARSSKRWPMVAGGVATGVLGIALYATLGAPGYGDMPLKTRFATMETRAEERPSQAVAQRAFIASMERPEAAARDLQLMEQLRAAIAARPGDVRGLQLLARNEALLGNFDAALAAQNQLLAVKGDAAAAEDIRSLAELMIVATGGYVSPEAEGALRRARALDPTDAPTLYYLGLMYDQIGRADRAFALWRPLLEAGQPGDSWVEPIRAQILGTAQRAGIRYVLPEARGPSDADIAAAQEMSPEDRAAMIEGMVQSLAQRLATQGGPPEDWARLITAQAVLGNRDAAQAILAEARQVFQDRADALNLFARAAQEAGLQ